MKQMIVNVGGLTIEEKQRVNEALAKITNVPKIKNVTADMSWFYAPSNCGLHVGWNGHHRKETSTHTPQQVLEMVVMTTKRKVREDFNPEMEYTVDVSGCTEEEKKEVQQGFFDVGILWSRDVAEYQYLGATKYTNKIRFGEIATHLLFGFTTGGVNMTAGEFLKLVYETEQKGHVHAKLMAQYAEDAKTSKTPWELWEFLDRDDGWNTFRGTPGWYETTEYRRKPKTHTVHGVEIPDLRVSPKYGEYYYLANPVSSSHYTVHKFVKDDTLGIWIERGLAYQHTEEGSQAAILHSKAMLGIA